MNSIDLQNCQKKLCNKNRYAKCKDSLRILVIERVIYMYLQN